MLKTQITMSLTRTHATHQLTSRSPSRLITVAASLSQRVRVVLGALSLGVVFTCHASSPAEKRTLVSTESTPLRLTLQAQLHATTASESPKGPAASEQDTLLRRWVTQQQRLYRVAAPLLLQNADLCKGLVRSFPGFTIKNKHSYSRSFTTSASTVLGLEDRLRVMDVLAGSRADESGLRPGDIVVAVNGEQLLPGLYAEQNATAIINIATQEGSELKLDLLRGTSPLTLQVPLSHGCALNIELGNSRDINSYTDGHRVMVTQGMVDFVSSDAELAYVLAKEIAHAALTSKARLRMASLIDRLRQPGPKSSPRAVAQPAPYSPVLDATADKLSLYMLARAGYDYEGALDFWKKVAARYPANILTSHTALHPSIIYRTSVMTTVVGQIKERQRLRRPLIP